MTTDEPLARMRRTMVERDIAHRGVKDPLVLQAMRTVGREDFVDSLNRGSAYADHPLNIGCGQTISQPYIVAFMTEALMLKGPERVLEIGTGSGYQAAVLAEIAAEVFSVERIAELSQAARSALAPYRNIHFHVGDGTLGWSEHAPYDAVIVTAAGPDVPHSLVEQLAPGGRLVAPVGPRSSQKLVRVTKPPSGKCSSESLLDVIFVPLIGREGHPE